MYRLPALISLVAILFLALTACGGGSSGGGLPAEIPGSPTKGTLRISVTDAPFPYEYVEEAWIWIQEVRVRSASESDEDAGWVEIPITPVRVNLVDLQGGISQAIVDAELDPGTYDQVRLLVEPDEVVLSPDALSAIGSPSFTYANGDLKFPSAQQSGLKVKIEGGIEVVTSLTSSLMLDFDLARNFVFNGPFDHPPGVKRVLFTPVVRATNTTTAGTIQVTVFSDNGDTASDPTPLEGATVSVLDETDAEVISGPTGADGVYSIDVPPGFYYLSITAPGHEDAFAPPQDDPTVDPTKEVVLANLTDFGDVVLHLVLEVQGIVESDNASADPLDDTPVAGISVDLVENGAILQTTTTDGQGAFQFLDTGSGPFTVQVVQAAGDPEDGYKDGFVTDVLGALQGAGAGVTLTLEALTVVVSGTVTDNAAAPLAGVSVSAESSLGFTSETVTTAADGTYQLTLPTGTYTLTFDNAGAVQTVSAVVILGTDPAGALTQDVSFP